MTVLEDLLALGFEPITNWVLKGSRIGLESLAFEENGGWLYAFVVDGDVKYIGLTTRVLRSRMDDYAYIHNSQTDRLRSLIMTELQAGRAVQIYGSKQSDAATLAAEESRLRALHNPDWNRI
ncbi:MAG TPA: hypothetical protein VNF68_15695 [Candidatus Baltobacteraceae bacterium]|nr:hypothetical protein [Candidatus Baltobacteraceae bacterium]